MKSLKLSVLAVILAGLTVSSVAFAQEGGYVGLLPSNPFYFLKELRRDVRKILAFKEIRKLELEIETANEKAAELRKMEEITPENHEALADAIENYSGQLSVLLSRVEQIKETSQNPELDRLLNLLIINTLRHYAVLNAILLNSELDADIRSQIYDLQGVMMSLLGNLTIRIDSIEKFIDRLENALTVENGGINDLKAAEFLSALEEKMAGEHRNSVSALKEDFLIKLSGQLEGGLILSGDVSLLSLLSVDAGNRQLRLNVLEELRERLVNNDIKTELNLLRQRLLEEILKEEGIGGVQALAIIDEAKALMEQLDEKVGEREGDVNGSVKLLMERAKFNLMQAESLYRQENFSGALGQATSAIAIIKSALNQLSASSDGWAKQAQVLKTQYDELLRRAQSHTATPRVLLLLKNAEKKIIELSGVIRNNATSPERINAAIKSIKLILATLDSLLR
ncbi:MAG: hypothetical protein G01um10143_827 [Parcubacteria group bacterium Gr01-1014_3]|nr:MAG: hypothetical protein G01um10143_827 [Parcubacteria group bacterium Gr01-1014_3]